MKLTHFETPEAAIEYITSDLLWFLREDLAGMTGSAAENYSDEEVAALEDKIADIKAIAPLLTIKAAA